VPSPKPAVFAAIEGGQSSSSVMRNPGVFGGLAVSLWSRISGARHWQS